MSIFDKLCTPMVVRLLKGQRLMKEPALHPGEIVRRPGVAL